MAQLEAKALLYCKEGKSDKVYGIALVADGESAACVIAFGARGAAGKPTITQGALPDMLKLYNSKIKEKSKTYKDLIAVSADPEATLTWGEAEAAITHLLRTLGGPGGHPVLSAQGGASAAATTSQIDGIMAPVRHKAPLVRLSHILPARKDDLPALLADPGFGFTEKVNGRRCVVVKSADGAPQAYNRSGAEVVVPAAAQALSRLDGSFVIDGEAMEREQAGAFYAFDLLERDGVSLCALPFAERIVRLKDDLLNAGLITRASATVAHMASAVPGLGLLFPAVEQEDKAAVLDEVRDSGGEGIVIRDMNGPSVAGDSRHELKIKFKGELDVVALEHQRRGGMVAGTFVIGVRRESDNAWIAIGAANSGLSHAQFEQVKAALERGEQPVFRIEFLTARTVGISPVEPVVVEVREDKPAADCVAGQLLQALGEDRASLITAAVPWAAHSQAA